MFLTVAIAPLSIANSQRCKRDCVEVVRRVMQMLPESRKK